MNFSTFASSIIGQSQRPFGGGTATPLFYSTATTQTTHLERPSTQLGRFEDDDILGDSELEEEEKEEGEEGDMRSSTLPHHHHHPRNDSSSATTTSKSVLGLSNVVPAFVTRLGGTSGGGNSSNRGGAAPRSRGWKAYESIAPHSMINRGGGTTLTDSDVSEEDEDDQDEGPLPGTFVSSPSSPFSRRDLALEPEHPLDEPLMGRRTLLVYPASATTEGRGVNSRESYRDSHWIVVYGGSLFVVFVISVQAFLHLPPSSSSSPSPPSTSYPSLLAATPLFLSLSLVSLFTSALTLFLLLLLRRTLRPMLTFSIFLGPFLFSLVGVIAFSASFGTHGVEGDGGWKIGMRVFALSCVVMSIVLGRSSIKRRKELNRAILVGELACQTIIHHPPLILLVLVLSFSSTLLSLPFLSLITTLLSLSRTHPHLASYGTTFSLFTYMWTLAVVRGIGKSTVSGVVGSWYFERPREQQQEGEEDGDSEGVPGPVEVTKAAFARATGPSFGTILISSLLTSLLSTLSILLRSLSRTLRSTSLPQFLSPLSILVPLIDFLTGWTNWWNGYTVSYAGLTGKCARESARDVAEVLFANRGANIRDTTLLRLLLTVTLYPLTLLPSLMTFLYLSSSYLSPSSGGYAPTFAVLSLIVPAWTGRVVLGLVTDAIDALFIATHLDVENQTSSCPKAVEAFAEPEEDTLATSFV